MGITEDARPLVISAMSIVDPAPIPINQSARPHLVGARRGTGTCSPLRSPAARGFARWRCRRVYWAPYPRLRARGSWSRLKSTETTYAARSLHLLIVLSSSREACSQRETSGISNLSALAAPRSSPAYRCMLRQA